MLNKELVPELLLNYVLAVMVNHDEQLPNQFQKIGDIMQTIKETKDQEKEYIINFHKRLFGILQKLKKDGYVDDFPDKTNKDGMIDNVYYVTFEGGMFLKNGGYIKAYKNEISKQQIQILKDWLLIIFTGLAGFGTLFLGLIEILKHYFWKT